MKKTFLYSLVILCCLCLYSTTSKECGKIISEKISVDAAAKKLNAKEKNPIKEEDTQTEFSFIHTIFFQTT